MRQPSVLSVLRNRDCVQYRALKCGTQNSATGNEQLSFLCVSMTLCVQAQLIRLCITCMYMCLSVCQGQYVCRPIRPMRACVEFIAAAAVISQQQPTGGRACGCNFTLAVNWLNYTSRYSGQDLGAPCSQVAIFLCPGTFQLSHTWDRVIFGSRDTSDCIRGSDVNKMSAC